jgi:hypothetical protein
MGLPSGQDVAKALGIEKPLTEDEIKNGSPEQVQILTTYGFDKHTPLWYYVLKEAERPESGGTLGQVGGRIVANVIMDALSADPNSYLSIDPAWKPQLEGQLVRKMIHLLRYAHHVPLTD